MVDRPAKCPFCSAPTAGESPVCEQCGLDLASDWRPDPDDKSEGHFDPRTRACITCGALNPVASNTCSRCGAPLKNIVAQLDPNQYYAVTMPSTKEAPGESLGRWLGRNVAGWASITMAVALVVMGIKAQALVIMAVMSLFPLVMGLFLLEVPIKLFRRRSKPLASGPQTETHADDAAHPAKESRRGPVFHLLAALGGIAIVAGLYAASTWSGPEAVATIFFVIWIAIIAVWCANAVFTGRLTRE
jgi:hypothetical protein